MYVTMSNAAQYGANLLQLPLVQTKPVGYGSKKILARYRASFLNTDIATLDHMIVAGTTYAFTAACSMTTAAGRSAALVEIEAIMRTILGNNNGRTILSITGTRIFITTDYSEVKIEAVGNGSDAIFIPTDAIILGDLASTEANFKMHVKLNAAGTYYVVKIKPLAGKAISAVNVDYGGSTDEYDSGWPTPVSYTLPTGTTIVNGYIQFEVLKATGDASATLVISITPVGGSAVVYSQSVVLKNYNNQ